MASDTRKVLHERVEAMAGVEVGVVGDLVADVYVYAQPFKLSREAPVVIARHEHERVVPGGGANVLANLASLGARACAVGRVGDDQIGTRLRDQLAERGVDVGGLRTLGETVTLTRYMVGSANTRRQQVLRVDRFLEETLPPCELELPEQLRGWVVSDYGYGAVSEEICTRLAARAAQGVPVVGDSRTRMHWFAGFTMVKPNQAEAEGFLGRPLSGSGALSLRAATELCEQLGVESALVTLGNLGLVLGRAADSRVHRLEAVGAREAVDVSGAGDTVCAVTLLALASGADPVTAAVLANRGAGVVVMHEGTTPLTAAELHEAIEAGGPGEDEPDLALLSRFWEDETHE